jgi:glycosyltransferase involved in cell wall biosynthesis
MKILHIIERFHPIIGGAEVQALQLIKKQIKLGLNVHVLTRKVSPELKSLENIYGIKIFRIKPCGLKGSKIGFALNVHKFIRRRRYDILHVHGIYSLFGMACIMSGKKVIGKITNSRAGLKQNQLIKKTKLFVLKNIDKIIVISKQIHIEVTGMGFKKNKIIVIPNGVDTNKFKPGNKKKLRKKLNLPTKITIACFSGRLVKQKGLDILLKSMVNIKRSELRLLLLVFGTGKLQEGSIEENMKKFVKDNNLEQNVKFVGNVTNLDEYLRTADFFFFPSRREGLPNALLEAASSGLPIVASKIGGNVDIIEDNYNGLLFESENTKELTKKILKLIKNERLQEKFAKNARKTVEEKFSLDVVCDRYIKLYQSLINIRNL